MKKLLLLMLSASLIMCAGCEKAEETEEPVQEIIEEEVQPTPTPVPPQSSENLPTLAIDTSIDEPEEDENESDGTIPVVEDDSITLSDDEIDGSIGFDYEYMYVNNAGEQYICNMDEENQTIYINYDNKNYSNRLNEEFFASIDELREYITMNPDKTRSQAIQAGYTIDVDPQGWLGEMLMSLARGKEAYDSDSTYYEHGVNMYKMLEEIKYTQIKDTEVEPASPEDIVFPQTASDDESYKIFAEDYAKSAKSCILNIGPFSDGSDGGGYSYRAEFYKAGKRSITVFIKTRSQSSVVGQTPEYGQKSVTITKTRYNKIKEAYNKSQPKEADGDWAIIIGNLLKEYDDKVFLETIDKIKSR